MRRTLPVGLAMLVPVVAPMLARAQIQQAPIVATPLLPPTVQYPQASPGPELAIHGPQPQYQQYQQPLNQPQYQPLQGEPSQYQPPQYQQQDQPLQAQQSQYQQQPQYQQPQSRLAPGQPPPTVPPSAPQQPSQQPLRGQPSPALQQSQPSQAAPPQGQQPPPAPGQPVAQNQGQQPNTAEPVAPPLPNPWLPQGSALLQALDKVNAQTATLTVKVGQTATYGSLSIVVQACEVRPPDMAQDAAAFLTIVDNHPDQPGFKGWMLKSNPSLSMLEHPLYDVRVIGCAP